MIQAHVFVDESKRRGLAMVAVAVLPGDLGRLRSMTRGLLMPGQSHIHFTNESNSRRRLILSKICNSDVSVCVYDATAQRDSRAARAACLTQLVADQTAAGSGRLVLERDDSLVKSDRATLYEAVRKAGANDQLHYVHLAKRSEPLLWIADAVAWSYTAGGVWRRSSDPVIRHVTMIPT